MTVTVIFFSPLCSRGPISPTGRMQQHPQHPPPLIQHWLNWYIVHCVSKETSPTFLTVTWKPFIRFWKFLVQIFLPQLATKWLFSFPPHPAFVSALPGENTTREISLFI